MCLYYFRVDVEDNDCKIDDITCDNKMCLEVEQTILISYCLVIVKARVHAINHDSRGTKKIANIYLYLKCNLCRF